MLFIYLVRAMYGDSCYPMRFFEGITDVLQSRKYLSSKGLLTIIHERFTEIQSPRSIAKRSAKPIALVDCLMSGLAIFSMKFPSLLQFEEQSNHGGIIKRNLRTLYQID